MGCEDEGLNFRRLTFVLCKARPRRHPLAKGRPGLPGRPGVACVCVGGRGERVWVGSDSDEEIKIKFEMVGERSVGGM